MLDLHRLRLLREVQLRGSMVAAARELAYSHSAVSQQLALLQQQAGVELFERSGRSIRLTPAGEQLARHAEAILSAVERAESDLALAQREPSGLLTVAAFATISRTVMPGVLADLQRDHPGLDVRLRLDDPERALERLLSRQVDAVLVDAYPGAAAPPGDAVHTTVLAHDPVRPYLPDPAIDVRSEAFRAVPWVMEPAPAGSTKWALRVCWERGVAPLVAHESTDLLFHLRMVEQGLAAAFLPDFVLRESGVRLAPSDALPSGERRILLLVRTGTERRPALEALRAAVATALDS